MENKIQQLKERIYALNPELKALNDFKRDWQDTFYDSGWEVDTIEVQKGEEEFMEDMSTFMYRHMPVYDWNLPYNENILLKIRQYFTSQIRLEHVLRAINATEKSFIGDWHINTRGHFVKALINGQCIGQAERYDLSKTFDQNIAENEELVNFLLDIIK